MICFQWIAFRFRFPWMGWRNFIGSVSFHLVECESPPPQSMRPCESLISIMIHLIASVIAVNVLTTRGRFVLAFSLNYRVYASRALPFRRKRCRYVQTIFRREKKLDFLPLGDLSCFMVPYPEQRILSICQGVCLRIYFLIERLASLNYIYNRS